MTHQTDPDILAASLDEVRSTLQRVGEGDNPILVQTIRHLFGSRGKFLRPRISLMSAQLFQTTLDQRLIEFAAVVEVIHTASLVHDDTLDEASTRRGDTTVNSEWNGHIAILVGDYLFAQAAIMTAALGSLRAMSMVADTIKCLVRGELRQMETSFDWSQTEDDYFEKIGNKTGSLFALPAAGAAVLANASEPHVAALQSFGFNLGLAFQIVDDILDLTETAETLGKPAGSDLAKGTITLPVLYYVQQATVSDRSLVVEGGSKADAAPLIAASSAIDRSYERAQACVDTAIEALLQVPAGNARDALVNVAQSAINRSK